jgi:hypothetical protein
MRTRALALGFVTLVVACSLNTQGSGPDGTSQTTSSSEPVPMSDSSAAPESPKHKHAITNCDADGDGFLSVLCGGTDCCDGDPGAHPGAEGFHDKPNACGSWDWNCDEKVEQETPPAKCKEGFLSCSGEGFEVDTPCGQEGTHYTCGYFFGCTKENQQKRPQRCK